MRCEFLKRCGSQPLAKDAHWPVQLNLNVLPGPDTRASGFRTRTSDATHKRHLEKVERGVGPYARGQQPHGRSGGSTSWAQQP